MFSEIDFQTAAQDRQATLLAEATNRRLTRASQGRPNEPQQTSSRLQTLLRRVAGAPTFAARRRGLHQPSHRRDAVHQ